MNRDLNVSDWLYNMAAEGPCRLRKKSVVQNDVNDNVSDNLEEKVDDSVYEETPGMLASLWAKTPSLHPITYVQEAPGMLVSLWRSTPSLQGVATAVQGVATAAQSTVKIPSILQSLVPKSQGSEGLEVDTDVPKVDRDDASLDSPVKSVLKVDAPVVKKVENKKQS